MKKIIYLLLFPLLLINGCKAKTITITIKYMEIDNIGLYYEQKDGFSFIESESTEYLTFDYYFEYGHVITEKELEDINSETTYNVKFLSYYARTSNYKTKTNVKYHDDILFPNTKLTQNTTYYYSIF